MSLAWKLLCLMARQVAAWLMLAQRVETIDRRVDAIITNHLPHLEDEAREVREIATDIRAYCRGRIEAGACPAGRAEEAAHHE